MRGLRMIRPYRIPRRWYLARIRWENGPNTVEISHEITISLCFEPRDLCIGLYWDNNEFERWIFYLYFFPCLPLRVKFCRSHGGRFG